MPEISVVIPTHNRWDLLQRTLAGALGQEGVEHEVIVVDDGSADGTHERLELLDEPRLTVIRHDTARGVARARNIGIEAATGRWIAFLDDDDLWSPRKLRSQLDAADDGNPAIVYAAMVSIDTNLDVLAFQDTPDPSGILDEILARQAMPGGCSNLIARTDLVREVGGFDPELRVAEDWDMWIRLLLAGDGRAARAPEYLYGYYQHTVSSVLLNKDLVQADYDYIAEKYAAARREHGVEMDTLNQSRWLARSFRRAGDRRGAVQLYLKGAREHRNLGNVVRAMGVLVGEGAMARLSPSRQRDLPNPDWLDLYRPGGRLESVASSAASDRG
jgi:glycosyltransferase involved in cell wall biosynthesis